MLVDVVLPEQRDLVAVTAVDRGPVTEHAELPRTPTDDPDLGLVAQGPIDLVGERRVSHRGRIAAKEGLDDRPGPVAEIDPGHTVAARVCAGAERRVGRGRDRWRRTDERLPVRRPA